MHASPLREYGIGILLIPYLFVFEVLKTNKDPLGGIPPKPPFLPPAFASTQIVK